MRRLVKRWMDCSIMVKTLCTQIVLVLVPLCVCLICMVCYLYLDFMSSSAASSYEYSRYAIDSFESQILQMKSSVNVSLENRMVRALLASDDPESLAEQTAIAHAYIASMTGNRAGVQSAALNATEFSGSAAQTILPVWHGTVRPSGSWEYSFTGENTEIEWVQCVFQNNLPIGMLRVRLTDTLLPNLAKSIADIVGGSCAVFSRDGAALYVAQDATDADVNEMRNHMDYAEGYHLLKWGSYINVLYLNAMDIVLISSHRGYPVTDIFHAMTVPIVVIILLLAGLAAFSMWLQNISVTKRIKLLINHIQKVNRLEAFTPVEAVEGNDEIGMLTKNYNHMMRQIIDLTQREHTAQMLQQTAKFNALQAQIQPHFLYNTLETLRMMADSHDDEEVADMLFVLGKLMRSSISGKSQETTIKRELENADHYLRLNRLRFPSLTYQIECEPDLPDFTCPRFILQPLVENSIQHGVSRTLRPGRVEVKVRREGEFVLISVSDNGQGIASERLEEIRQALAMNSPLRQAQGGIGISNVYSRLRIFYGDNSGIDIESEPGVRTVCTMRIEWQKKLR